MAAFISLIRTGPLVLNQPPEAVFAPMLLVEAPHEPCVVFDARFRTEMIGKPGTRQQISCRIRVLLRRAPIEDAFQHAAIKSGNRGRIFLLQRLGRGSQRIVGRPVQFRQPLPDEPVGALNLLVALIGLLISAGPALSENASDWITGLPREPIHV